MTIRAIAVTRRWRIVLSVLAVLSRGGLLVVAVAFALAPGAVPPAGLLRAVAALWLAPEVLFRVVRGACAATITVAGGVLVVRTRGEGIDVPVAGIATVAPWPVPLPAPGFDLVLRSGGRLPEALVPDDPRMLLSTLADAGLSHDALEPAARHPLVRYAEAKHDARRRLDHPLVQFGLFSLVPTLPLFRLRQFLVYGGTFGEWYQYGLRTYLMGFGLFWLLFAVYLVLYGAALRAATEAVALVAAYGFPAHAARVRGACEWTRRLLYYGGVPAVLALRLYPW